MIKLGTPSDSNKFFMTDDSELIFRLHQAGFFPSWKDEECIYIKKSNKLMKYLKKIGYTHNER